MPRMSSPTPAHHDMTPPPGDRFDWLPSRRGLLLVALALAGGLLLFALVWRSESRRDFYTVEPVARPSSASEFEPLPAPLPANRDRGASGMDERGERERTAERARQAEREAAERRAAEVVEAPVPEPPPPAAPVATRSPVPLAGRSPPPTYPRRALRRGDQGVVLLRVDVSADGVPTSVGIVRSSRSRELDRAAVDAVGRWRFQPATADGRAVPGTVEVPIEFTPDR